ncbi:MAG: hypothetical protein KatS3mg104_1164 [Phycisphaerae bacterium]|nr:MAG: hypothetical protein KatS3mg104_1164 [Phycisphaerae bacterium]
MGELAAFLADEGGAPGVGEEPGVLVRRRADQFGKVLLFGGKGLGRRVVFVGQVGEGLDEVAEFEPLGLAEGYQPLAAAFVFVAAS